MTASVYGITLAGLLDWLNVMEPPYGAKGDGVTDDTAAIQNALNAAPIGGTVYLPPPPANYAVSAPLTIPPQVRLLGWTGTHIDATTCTIKPVASFTGAAVLLLLDQTTGGYALPNVDAHIANLTIDGSNLTGTTIDGIQAQGYVHGLTIDNVQIRSMPNHGIATVSNASGTPYSWRVTRVVANACLGYGFSISMTDSTWMDVQAIGCGKSGWYLGPNANSHFLSCRAEWNAYDGFTITGSTGSGAGSGGCTFVSCSTDRNAYHGVNINATGPTPLIFTGLLLRRDGRSSTTSGYAGICVNSGSTVPVIVNGATVFPGTNDDNTGNASPQYGFSIVGSSRNVALNSGFFQGISAGIRDDGTNSNWWRSPNVLEATGATNTQTFASAFNWATTGQGSISQSADAIALQLSNSVTNTTNALLNYVSGGATGLAAKSRATGDTVARFQRDVAGKMQWGSGSATADTNLYRSAAGTLATDQTLSVGQSLSVGAHALGIVGPQETGLQAWVFDPANVASGKAGTAGTLYLAALYVARAVTVTKLLWGINTAGASPTSGQNFVGLYSSAGSLLASVGVDARVTSTGMFTETINVAVTPGQYWVAFMFNATTMPSVYRGQDLNATLMNSGASTSTLRFCTNGTGLTTALPANITPASNAAAQYSYWAAIG
ncbi:glycosyl hydrolase family 28-related protein [Kitasatospora sp. NPDC001683]